MKSIPNRACEDKRRHAPALPEMAPISAASEAAHTRKVELAHKWLDAFDLYTREAYDSARQDAHSLERLIQHEAQGVVDLAVKSNIMDAFPFPAHLAGCSSSLDLLGARADVLGLELKDALLSHEADSLFPLLRFVALHILRAQHVLFADELREAAFFARGDENARNDNPMFYRLFEMYLDHSGRADELKADGLLISDILTDGAPVERDAAYFAGIFEADLIRLYDEKRDRLAVVTHTLPQHRRPRISEEEVKSDRTLGLVVSYWEREHSAAWASLEKEKEQLEKWLATEGLEKSYWWSRGVDNGLNDCAAVKPAIGLALDYWRKEGIAGPDITVDAIWEELFRIEGES